MGSHINYEDMTDAESCATGYHRRKDGEACACGYKEGRPHTVTTEEDMEEWLRIRTRVSTDKTRPTPDAADIPSHPAENDEVFALLDAFRKELLSRSGKPLDRAPQTSSWLARIERVLRGPYPPVASCQRGSIVAWLHSPAAHSVATLAAGGSLIEYPENICIALAKALEGDPCAAPCLFCEQRDGTQRSVPGGWICQDTEACALRRSVQRKEAARLRRNEKQAAASLPGPFSTMARDASVLLQALERKNATDQGEVTLNEDDFACVLDILRLLAHP